MATLLAYDVLYCTSEDSQHPVSYLGGSTGEEASVATSPLGWQSAPNGKSPQTLVLRFTGNVWLQQLRILSHESKIASRVEVRVAKLSEDDDWDHPPSFREIRFVKLGSVDFNSNEQSRYKSKERKTVHLKTEAYYLKLLFDRPHENPYNTARQISIYSIECSGHVLTPSRRRTTSVSTDGASPRHGRLSAAPAAEERDALSAAAVPPSSEHSGASPTFPGPAHTGSSSPALPLVSVEDSLPALSAAFRSVRIVEFEDFFLRRSEELVSLKAEAVAVEDFRLAAECQDKLMLLNRQAKEVYELENEKVRAIIDEAFEAAELVKVRMNELLSQLYAQVSLPCAGGLEDLELTEEEEEEEPQRAANMGEEENGAARLLLYQPSTVPLEDDSRSTNEEPDATSIASKVIDAAQETQLVISAESLGSWERAVAEAILDSAGAEEERTVTLANPGFDVQPLIGALGRFTTACLLSRRFKLREAALTVVTEQFDAFPALAAQLEDVVLRFLDINAYGVQDAIPNVVFAACTFIRTSLADVRGCISNVLTPLVALLPRLITRCSDNLQRIRDEALMTLTVYVKTPAIPTAPLLSATLADPTDKDRRTLPLSNAKAQLARLHLFELLVEHNRLHMESSGPASANALQRLLLPTMNHANSEVRDLAVSIVTRLVTNHQIIVRDRDLSKITKGAIRAAVASKRR